jgi:hypothetical protein
MKRLRALVIFLVIFTCAFLFVGCSAENAVKTASGGKVAVDKKGNVEIKDKNGNAEMKLENAKWNKEKMYGLDAPKATLESSITINDSTTYSFLEMKAKDALLYIQKIKDAGFAYNYVSVDEYNYTGTNKDGLMISFMYSKDSKSGSITAAKGDKPTQGQAGIDFRGENSKWDSSLIGGLPDPGAKITASSIMETSTTYNFDKFENPKDYLTKIKEHGFTIEATETELPEGIMYHAKNNNGDTIDFMTGSNQSCTIIFSKASN